MAAEEIIFKVGVDTGNSVNDLGKIEQGLESINGEGQKMGNSLEDRFNALNKKIQSGELSMGDLKAALREYQTIAIQAGRESPIGQQAIAAAGELKDTIGDLRTELTNAGTDGANMQAALQLGSSIAAGYGVMQGTMALLGSESEELEKNLQKLMAVQTLLSSVEEIRSALEKESFLMMKARALQTQVMTALETVYTAAVGGTTGAMKALRLAMLALPIVAIIAGVVALVSNFDKLSGIFKSTSEKQKLLNETLDEYKQGAKGAIEQTSKVKNSFELAREGVISKEEALRIYNDTLGDSFGKAKNLNEAEELYSKKTDAYIKATALRAQSQALFAKAAEEQVKALTANMEDQTGILDKAKSGLISYFGGVTQGAKSLIKSQIDATKEVEKTSNKKAKAMNSLAADLLKEAELTEKSNGIKSETEQKLAEERKQREKEYAEKKKEALKEISEAEKEYRATFLSDQEREVQAVNDKYKKLIDQAKKYGQDTSTLENARLNAINDINTKYAQEELKVDEEKAKRKKELQQQIIDAQNKFLDDQESFDEEYRQSTMSQQQLEEDAVREKYFRLIELAKQYGYDTKVLEEKQQKELKDISDKYEKERADAKIKIAQDSLQLVSNITELFGRNNEKAAKRAFQIDKAAKLASATIAGIEGTINAYKSAQASLITPYFPAYPAIQAGLAAAFAATNIAKIAQTQFSGNSGGGSQASVPAPSQGVPSVPTPEVNANTTLTAGLPGSGSQAGNKVYVLDSEITAQQTMSQKVTSLATFGG